MSLRKTGLVVVFASIFQYMCVSTANALPEVESLADVASHMWEENERNDVSISDNAATTFFQADEYQIAGEGTASSPHNPMLALFQKMAALQEEIQELRGRVEEQEHQLSRLKQAQHDNYLDFDRRLRADGPQKIGGVSSLSLRDKEILNNLMVGSLDAQAINQESAQDEESFVMDAVETAEQLESISEEKMYNQAYQFIQHKNYDNALKTFKSMMKSFPDGQYKANGHYWMGEIYMVRGELDFAANEFNTVYQLYPKSSKAADALLKLGYVEYAKGEWERSKELLSKVQAQFPGSSSARLASTRLQRMQQERF